MPRSKPHGVNRTHVFVRAQDQSAFRRRLLEHVGDEITDEMAADLEGLAREVNILSSGRLYEAEIDLKQGARAGSTTFEPAYLFPQSAVGSPVMITLAPDNDAGEWHNINFTGLIESRRRMALHWTSRGPAPAAVKVLYLFGRVDDLEVQGMQAAGVDYITALVIAALGP